MPRWSRTRGPWPLRRALPAYRARAAVVALGAALAAALSVAPSAAGQTASAPAPPSGSTAAAHTVVLLVRHAEKAVDSGNDPALSAAGELRSRALAEALVHFPVDAVIATQYRRTRLTARHVIEARRLTPEVIPAQPDVAAHAAAIAAAIRERYAGRTILVVGHSNTIPGIIAALGGPRMPDLCDGEYASLFVMILSDRGTPRLLRSWYGVADEPTVGCPEMGRG